MWYECSESGDLHKNRRKETHIESDGEMRISPKPHSIIQTNPKNNAAFFIRKTKRELNYLEKRPWIWTKELFDLGVLREDLTPPRSVRFVRVRPEEVCRHYPFLSVFSSSHFSLSPFEWKKKRRERRRRRKHEEKKECAGYIQNPRPLILIPRLDLYGNGKHEETFEEFAGNIQNLRPLILIQRLDLYGIVAVAASEIQAVSKE